MSFSVSNSTSIYMHPTEAILMIDHPGLKKALPVNQVRHGRILGKHWWSFVFGFFSYSTVLGPDESRDLKAWLDKHKIAIVQ